MDSLEAWLDFRRGERVDPTPITCHDCGKVCTGDVTVAVVSPDGEIIDLPICDEPDTCPGRTL